LKPLTIIYHRWLNKIGGENNFQQRFGRGPKVKTTKDGFKGKEKGDLVEIL
jgi:hypothetical protein